MTTEHFSPRFKDLDTWDDAEILRALQEGQLAAAAAVGAALAPLGTAVRAAADRLKRGGRLAYVGAGSSGRIAVQDAAELGPTFGWPRERLVFLMAGGAGAFTDAVEGAEDSTSDAAAQSRTLGADDVAIGVSASGRTPFTTVALEAARRNGALTVGVANTPGSPLLDACDYPILIDTGPEPIGGSTRLHAGTAQKIALNLFSTLLMIRLGRVYGSMMVGMRATNEKLRRRSERIVMTIGGVDREAAAAAMAQTDNDIKLAVLVALGVERADAEALLARHDSDLRRALTECRSANKNSYSSSDQGKLG